MTSDERAIRELIATWRSGNTLSVLKKQNGSWVIFRDANLLSVVN